MRAMPATIRAPPARWGQRLRVRAHAEPSEIVDRERCQNIGGDEQAVERSSADLVDERQAAEHGDGSGETLRTDPTSACVQPDRASEAGRASP